MLGRALGWHGASSKTQSHGVLGEVELKLLEFGSKLLERTRTALVEDLAE